MKNHYLVSVLVWCLTGNILVHNDSVYAEPSKDSGLILQEGTPVLSAESKMQAKALPDLSLLVKDLSPAVVNISVESASDEIEPGEPAEGMPFFKKDPDRPFRSVGSGFIVNPEGYIVTSNHVIEKSQKVIVRLLNDKVDYPARTVGRDPKTDLALLKIDPKHPVNSVFLGDSDSVEVGEWVVAIGNQFQLGQTVTAGIISAKARRIPSKASGPYDSFIQTDASINPGSSGGPLFNTKGQVIGINTAIFSPARSQLMGSGFNIGIGFAVPVNVLKGIIQQLKEAGRVTRGLLGVKIQPVDEKIAQVLGLENTEGALVADVVPDSPAIKSGFKRRDVVVSFAGHPVVELEDLPIIVASTPVGSSVDVEVIRNGKRRSLRATIAELKDDEDTVPITAQKANEIGLMVDELTETQAKILGMERPSGALVTGVENGSAAEKAGIVRGDVIEEIGEAPVSDKEALDKLLRGLARGKTVLVTVRRKDGTRILTVDVK